MLKKGELSSVIISFVFLTIIILAVSSYFIEAEAWIGPAFIVLGVINLFLIKFFNIEIKSLYPDIVFGFIDNGVLVFAAVLGGIYAGIAGAIIGGAAGNTITDGIGGFFEGYIAEKNEKKKIKTERAGLSSMLGKMAGCLFGAGAGLIALWLIEIFFNLL